MSNRKSETDACHEHCFVFSQPMTMFQIQFLNAVGDLLDLIPSLSPTKSSSMKKFKIWEMGHCSALIKVRPAALSSSYLHGPSY